MNTGRAMELYRQSCNAGFAEGCDHLGSMYERGKEVSPNVARAVELYRGACDAGYEKACSNLERIKPKQATKTAN